MNTFTQRPLDLHHGDDQRQLMGLLKQFELTFSEDTIDYTAGIFDGETLIATASLSGRVFRNIAISPDYQGKGLTHRLLAMLEAEADRRGITGFQIFTKPEKYPFLNMSGSVVSPSQNRTRRCSKKERLRSKIFWRMSRKSSVHPRALSAVRSS